ncbi:MAG: hypothetical protein R3Y60_01950 [bacterium]
MNLATLQGKIIDYAMNEIIPNLPPMGFSMMGMPINLGKSAIQFLGGIGLGMSTFNLEKYAYTLKMVGIIDENNIIDTDRLSTLMRENIEKVGVLEIAEFKFTKEDVEKFITYIS